MTYVAVSEVAEINPKFLPSNRSDLSKEVSFVPMAAVSDEHGRIEVEVYRPLGEVLKGFRPFEDGDVLVAKITPCFENGKIAHAKISREWGFGSTEFHVLRANSKHVDDRYIYHFVRTPSVKQAGERRMTGSAGQKRVPKAFLESLKLPLPPLPEQKRIAAILDQADALREKRRAAIAKLDELLQSVFLDMFGDPVTNPKGWNKQPLSDLLSNIESGWSPKCDDKPVREGQWGVLKLGSVTWCHYNASENKALPITEQPRLALEVKAGNLLFTRKNTYDLVAAAAYVWDTPSKLMLPDLIFRLCVSDDTILHPIFLWQQLVNAHMRKEIQSLAGGAAGSMPNISKAKLKTIEVIVPPIELQNHYVDILKTHRKQQERQLYSLNSLEHAFSSLQQRAFRGEL